MKPNLLIEEPQDVLNILELIKKEAYHRRKREVGIKAEEWAMDLLSTRSDIIRIDILGGSPQDIASINWRTWFLRTGAIILSLIEEWTKFEELAFAKFLLGKHLRYKAGPLFRWKELGILIRLDSKLARLINITEDKGLGTEDEPAEKTAEDILGYCILGYLLNKELKK